VKQQQQQQLVVLVSCAKRDIYLLN